MRVYDPSRQESLHLSRRLACGGGPLGLLGCCCCYMQRLDVLLPPGRPLGAVAQEWAWLAPELSVRDSAGNVIYRVVGPVMRPWECTVREAVFKITSRDGLVELGAISHQWKPSVSSLVTRIIFPSAELNVHHKALILSAAFLLEYMFFESAKKRSCLPCC
ncbi:phospholipid scramblase 3 [Frankliniella occidentalis]|uniref:Phospholipid scramblase n=1 Tax=Frankliniella occidentalis TaxID=133901 RepID=A0A9C6XAH5_FRAOC|nr:phospholipid scramblase 3 [Frankliniella occidentalis]